MAEDFLPIQTAARPEMAGAGKPASRPDDDGVTFGELLDAQAKDQTPEAAPPGAAAPNAAAPVPAAPTPIAAIPFAPVPTEMAAASGDVTADVADNTVLADAAVAAFTPAAPPPAPAPTPAPAPAAAAGNTVAAMMAALQSYSTQPTATAEVSAPAAAAAPAAKAATTTATDTTEPADTAAATDATSAATTTPTTTTITATTTAPIIATTTAPTTTTAKTTTNSASAPSAERAADAGDTVAADTATNAAGAKASGQAVSPASAQANGGQNGGQANAQANSQGGADIKADAKMDVAASSTNTSTSPTDTLVKTGQTIEAPKHPALTNAPQAVAQVYTRMIERMDGRAQRFEIRLDPEELGRVDVRIEIGADKKVRAVLAAHDGAAMTDLMRGQKALERALTDAGIDLADGGLQFETSADTGRGLTGNEQRGEGWNSNDNANVWRGFNTVDVGVDVTAADLAAATRSYRRAASRLDLVA